MTLTKSAEISLKWRKGAQVTNDLGSLYCLVTDVQEALERVKFLKGLYVTIFAQPYRDYETNTPPTAEQQRFARWVNHTAIFKSVEWKDYKPNKRASRANKALQRSAP